MFAGDDDGVFGVGGGFEVGGFFVEDGFAAIAEFGFHAFFDGHEVGLDPDESGGVAGGTEELADFGAVGFGADAAFEDDGLLALGDFFYNN